MSGKSNGAAERIDDAGSEPVAMCRHLAKSASFTLGTPGPAVDDDERQLDVPYAVELGGAARLGDGFAIAALEPLGAGSHAIVALLGADASSGSVLDLGVVHGDSAPPRVSSDREALAVVLEDADAGGVIVRLAIVRAARTKPDVDWGFDAGVGWDGATAFDVSLSGGRGAVVLDKVIGGRRGVHVIGFSSLNPDRAEPDAIMVSAHNSWAESPRIVARQGGFWVAWLERLGADTRPREVVEEAGVTSVIEVGLTRLKVMPLSSQGEPLGEATAVHGSPARIFAYDLGTDPDGGALVAWRQGGAGPGVEQGFVHLARVGVDGAVVTRPIESDDAGVGVPTLLGASEPRGMTWLALHAAAESVQLTRVLGDKLEAPPRYEPAVGSSEALLRSADRLLTATPRGRAIEFGVVSCPPRIPAASSSAR